MSPIENPYDVETDIASMNGHGEQGESMDSLFNKEVDAGAAQEAIKRNMAPAGTYVTEPEDFPATILAKQVDEKDKGGEVVGQRVKATVLCRATARIKGDDITQVLRFDISPEQRFKKIYEDSQWTGEYDTAKDDIAYRLWSAAVMCYEEFHGKGTKFTQNDVLEFLKSVPVALRTMQGDRGELVVLSIQSRGKRRG